MVCVRRFDGTAWGPHPVLLGAPSHKDVQTPAAVLSPGDQVAVLWRQGSPANGAILAAMGRA